MSKRLFLTLTLVLLLNVTLSIHANEKIKITKVKQSNFSFNVNNTLHLMEKYQSNTDSTNYQKKRRGMLALGGVGIGIMTVGFIMGVAGGYVFGYYHGLEPTYSAANEMGGTVPQSWYQIKFYGLGVAAAGAVLFLAGLAMTIAGFAMARYYKNKTTKVSMSTFTEFENNIMRTGFAVRL